MKKILATIPILGTVTVEVEVRDDEEDDDIFEAAMEAFDEDISQWEWDFKRKIVDGNVFHGHQNEWKYEELEDDEQEEQEEKREHQEEV